MTKGKDVSFTCPFLPKILFLSRAHLFPAQHSLSLRMHTMAPKRTRGASKAKGRLEKEEEATRRKKSSQLQAPVLPLRQRYCR